jgi:molybdopterin converting factor small subunit
MRVLIPSALYSYTGHKSEVDASGATVDELLRELDRRYPGLRFRMFDEQDCVRPHMKIYINGEATRNIRAPLRDRDEVAIIMALSGG